MTSWKIHTFKVKVRYKQWGLELERLKCLPGIEEVIKDAIKWHYGKFRTQSILDCILLSTSQDISHSAALILTISLSMCLSSLKSSTESLVCPYKNYSVRQFTFTIQAVNRWGVVIVFIVSTQSRTVFYFIYLQSNKYRGIKILIKWERLLKKLKQISYHFVFLFVSIDNHVQILSMSCRCFSIL